MSTFELVWFGCGDEKPCKRLASGDLEDAIRIARELMDDDPMNVVEVRRDGKFQCSIGKGWMSRRAGAA